MTITVNGQERPATAGLLLGALVEDVCGGPTERGVAVAVNGSVVPRSSWTGTALSAGDRVEILTAAQGG